MFNVLIQNFIAFIVLNTFNFTGSYFKLNERVKLLSFLFDQYGPVVRVMGPFGGDIVLLSRPDHMQSVFNQEGPQPVRSAFDSLEYYRTKHRKFDFPGLYSV